MAGTGIVAIFVKNSGVGALALVIAGAAFLLIGITGVIITQVNVGGTKLNLQRPDAAELRRDLVRIEPAAAASTPEPSTANDDWTGERESLRIYCRGIFLDDLVAPSDHGAEWRDIFVFLVGHKRHEQGLPPDLSDVVRAEFFFGRFWGNQVYTVLNSESRKRIGVTTSAYGPTFCLCRIGFSDGHTAILNRFLDFTIAVPVE